MQLNEIIDQLANLPPESPIPTGFPMFNDLLKGDKQAAILKYPHLRATFAELPTKVQNELRAKVEQLSTIVITKKPTKVITKKPTKPPKAAVKPLAKPAKKRAPPSTQVKTVHSLYYNAMNAFDLKDETRAKKAYEEIRKLYPKLSKEERDMLRPQLLELHETLFEWLKHKR